MTAKKKNNKVHISFNAPATLIFSLISLAVFLIDSFLLKNKVVSFLFTCPSKIGTEGGFNFTSPLDYLKLFTHVLGNTSWTSLFVNLSLILLSGPTLEERYGTGSIILAMTISAFVTGIINVCALTTVLTGNAAVVLLMILLATVAFLDKKELPLTYILVLILYCAFLMYTNVKSSAKAPENFLSFLTMNLPVFINLAGGICGSLIGFLTSPKKARTKKTNIHKDATVSYSESAVSNPSDDDATIVAEL